MDKTMADTQEFLDEVLENYYNCRYGDAIEYASDQHEIREETKQAILEHFQQEQGELKEYATYCCSVKAIGEPFIDGQLFSGRCSDCKEISPLHEVDDEPTRYAEVDGKKPYYTQSEVDRLIREAIEKEWGLIHETLHSANLIAEVHISKAREERLESLSKQKERSK